MDKVKLLLLLIPSPDWQGSDEGLEKRKTHLDIWDGWITRRYAHRPPFMDMKGTRRHKNIKKCCKADIKQHREVENKTTM